MARLMASTSALDGLLKRYAGSTRDMLDRVLTPYRLRITKKWLEERVVNGKGKRKRRITLPMFSADVPSDVWTIFEDGTTGKVIPKEHVEGSAAWKELIKGRIRTSEEGKVEGELYFAPDRLDAVYESVKVGDYLEIDPFGIAAAICSALCEAAFFRIAAEKGFKVTRMPANVAMGVGTQNYFDFRLERDGKVYRVESKSLWGTDTRKARLIHTKSRDKQSGGKNSQREDRQVWDKSSCRFRDQDIFAVAMWLRTGCVDDFIFALSATTTEEPVFGLPPVKSHPHHVTQNPAVQDPPTDPWTSDLNVACKRVDRYRAKRKLSERPPTVVAIQDNAPRVR